MRSWIFAVAALVVLPAWGDVVRLQDGTTLDGTLKREPGGWAVTDKTGKTTHITDDKVDSIEKTGSATAADATESKLNVLRRSVENLTDIAQITDRYTKFIEQNRNTPAAATAQKELEVWQDRQSKGLVKVGGAWVTPAEQGELLGKTAAVVEEVRGLIRAARWKEADAAAGRLLAGDANSVTGLYLRGVVAAKQEQLGVARKSFERVRELMADHGPTLNNLGVIAWRQKQAGMALAMYDFAMVATPRNRRILDNVAEALGAVGDSEKNSTVGKKVIRHFQEQDVELAKQLAQEGLTRFGATYLTKEQAAEVKKVQAKIDLLVQDEEKVVARVQEIERQVSANNETLRRIDRESNVVDPGTGQVVRLRRPSIFYDIKRDNDLLDQEVVALDARRRTYDDRKRAVWAESPVKPFTGVHRIIEAEGTPLVATNVGASTQPTTRPSGG